MRIISKICEKKWILISLLLEYVSALVMQVFGKPAFFVIDRTNDEALRAFDFEKYEAEDQET